LLTWPLVDQATLRLALAALTTLFLPGLAWTAWRSTNDRRDALERLADAAALSIAITALLALIFFLFHIPLQTKLLRGLYAICLLLGALGLGRRHLFHRRLITFSITDAAWTLLGILALLGVLIWRMDQARTLLLPAWVDSVHHTLIIQKFLAAAGLPNTLSPELPFLFSYHYGSHALVALFCTLSGMEPAQALLWFGQWLNALLALTAYRVGRSFRLPRPAAILALLLVGFTFQMPAYYLSWGRVPLPAGLIVLGSAQAAALMLNQQRHTRPTWLRLTLLTAGSLLTHYITSLLLAIFLAALLGGRLLQALSQRQAARSLLKRAWMLASAGATGLLLALPWLTRTWIYVQGRTSFNFTSPLNGTNAGYLGYLWYLLGPKHAHLLHLAALLGLLIAALQHRSRPLALWSATWLLLGLPWGLHLREFRPDLIVIMAFLPAALLNANALHTLTNWLGKRLRPWFGTTLFWILTLALTVWGIQNTSNILNPITVFADANDLQALNWIKTNTPLQARFLINTTPWQSVYRGVDGGYWITPLTGRWSALPPALYNMDTPENVSAIQQRATTIASLTTCDDKFWQIVTDNQITHVYTKQGIGSLQAQALKNCPNLLLVYQKQTISIYEVLDNSP
jgi:hypothetical protein